MLRLTLMQELDAGMYDLHKIGVVSDAQMRDMGLHVPNEETVAALLEADALFDDAQELFDHTKVDKLKSHLHKVRKQLLADKTYLEWDAHISSVDFKVITNALEGLEEACEIADALTGTLDE